MNFKHYVLLSTALVGVNAASSALAQTATPTAGKGDDIVVTGIRKSLKKSLDVKRNADAQIDVITAESVGKFPDTNVAESLSHLPGIAVDRAYGEGEKLTILGIDSNLNKIWVDGHSIASADWGGNPNDPTSRSFNYSILAPELIGQAEVYKSSEARLDEGAIGGTVIVHTRRPLDLDSNTFIGSLGVSQNQKPGDQQRNPRGSILGSWKNDQGTLGWLAAYSYNKDTIGGSSDGTFGLDVASKNYANGIRAGDYVPTSIDQGAWTQDRIRQTLSTDIEWKPNANWEFNLSGLAINGIYNNYSQTLFSYLDWQGTDKFTNVQRGPSGLITSAYQPNGAMELDDFYRKTSIANRTYDFSGKWTEGPWKVTADIGHTEAVSSTNPSYYLNLYGSSPISYTYNRDGASEIYTNSISDPHTLHLAGSTTPNSQQAGFVESYFTHDKEDFGQADGSVVVDFGPINKILFGAKYSRHSNDYFDEYYNLYTDVGVPISVASFDYFVQPRSWSSGIGAGGDVAQYATITKSSLINWAQAHATGSHQTPQSRDWWVTEDTGDLYAQAEFRQDKWHGNFGLRYVYTKDILSWDDQASITDASGNTTNTETQGHANKAYYKGLPAVNVVYDLEKDLLLRFTAAQVIARPKYNQLSGGQSISVNNSTGQLTGGGGNPDLKPYEAINYGASVEWYFAKDSLLSLDLFYRDVSNYIVTDNDYRNIAGYNKPVYWSSVFNADGAKVSGFSATLQSALPYGFGFSSNFTYTNADTTSSNGADGGTAAKLTMPYLSRYLLNIIPYYENGPWTARVSYNFRSKYTTDIGVNGGADYTDQWSQLDATVSYKFDAHVTMTAAVQNLIDPVAYQFLGTRDLPESWNKNGSKASIGVSYRY